MSEHFFRAITEADAPAVYQLFQSDIDAAWPSLGVLPQELEMMGENYISSLIQSLQTTQLGLMIGAFDFENQLIACAGLTRNERMCSRHTARVIAVIVAKEHRQKGLANALLQQVIQSCALSQIERLNIDTAANQPATTRLYQQHGFTQYGVEPAAIRYQDETFDRLLLTREITEADAIIDPAAEN